MLTPQQFEQRTNQRFAYNTWQSINDASFRDFGLDISALAKRGPNDLVGSIKYVIYLTRAEAERAERLTYASLDQVKPETIVLGNLARIDLFPGAPGTWLTTVYDDGLGPYPISPGFAGIADGTGQLNFVQLPGTGLIPMKWVLKDSVEAATANVALYKKGKEYRENDLVRGLFGTFPSVKSVVFYANESGTDIPAPSRPEGDAYWSVFNPAPATYAPWQTVTPDELRKLKASAKLSAGRLYIVTPRLIPGDESDGSYPDVFVRALLESELEPTAYLLVGASNSQVVTYDLATDTTTPVQVASTFKGLQGDPYASPALAAALSGFTKPFVLKASGSAVGYATAQAAADAAPAGSTLYCYADVPTGLVLRVSMTVEASGHSISQLLVAAATSVTARFRTVGGCSLGGDAVLDATGDLVVNTSGDSALFGYNVRIKWRGNVQFTTTNANGGAFYVVGPASSLDYAGAALIGNRGVAIRAGSGAQVTHRGSVVSADGCVSVGNGAYDGYATLDNRASSWGNSPLVVSQNAAFYQNHTLHANAELLAPAGVAGIRNANPGQTALVEVVGTLATTGPVPAAVQLVPLTPAGAAAGGPWPTPGTGVVDDTANTFTVPIPLAGNFQTRELGYHLSLDTSPGTPPVALAGTATAGSSSIAYREGDHVVVRVGNVAKPAGAVGVCVLRGAGRAQSAYSTNLVDFTSSLAVPSGWQYAIAPGYSTDGDNRVVAFVEDSSSSVLLSGEWGIDYNSAYHGPAGGGNSMRYGNTVGLTATVHYFGGGFWPVGIAFGGSGKIDVSCDGAPAVTLDYALAGNPAARVKNTSGQDVFFDLPDGEHTIVFTLTQANHDANGSRAGIVDALELAPR